MMKQCHCIKLKISLITRIYFTILMISQAKGNKIYILDLEQALILRKVDL